MFYLVVLSSLLLSSLIVAQDICPNDIAISLTRPGGVIENGHVTFTCLVNNTPSSTYALPTQVNWLKDFVSLDTSDTSRYRVSTLGVSSTEAEFKLEILRSEVADSGTYSCDPVIPGVLCRESVDLIVNYALAVIVEDQDQVEGEDVELECLVRGLESRGIWYRYNETTNIYTELDGSNSKYTLSQDGSYFYLSFDSATKADTGVYRCVAVSPSGRAERDFSFYALVAPSNTLIKGGTEGQFFGLTGDNLVLICESQGIRDPKYNWTVNGVILEENTAKLVFNRTNGQLDILAAAKDDEGTYACVAYNKAGVETVQVAVIIHITATITSQVLSVKVGLGAVGNLSCTVLASPPVDRVDWFKIPSSIGLTNTTKHTYYLNGTLLISDAQEGDDAPYSLKACNSISGIIHCTQSQPISLIVILFPPAPQALEILSENLNAHEVTIGWTNPATDLRTAPASYLLQLRPSLTDQFINLDEEIPVGSSGGYMVTKLFPGYPNFFRILGSNLAGLGAPSNELNVTLPPGIPRIRKVSVDFLTSSSIKVMYELWHDGGEKLRELVVQYKVNSSNVWLEVRDSFLFKNISYFAVISNLRSSMYYDIRVAVSNSLGFSEYFVADEIGVPDSLPGTPVLEAVHIRLDSATIRISLADPGTGELLGFFVLYSLNASLPAPIPVFLSDDSLKVGAPTNTWELSITGLESQTTYKISAAANSSIGIGPYSSDLEIYTESESFFSSIYFKIFVAVLGFVVIVVVCLLLLLICIGCLCFRFGKKTGYFHIQKVATSTGVENLALTESSDSPKKSPTTDGAVRNPLKEDARSYTSTPPVIPPRLHNVFEDSFEYHSSPPLAGYTTVKDPKHFQDPNDFRSPQFADLSADKNFLGQDRHPSQSQGNISQGSFITDV